MGNAVSRLIVPVAGLMVAAFPAAAQTDADADPAALVATQVREQGFECSDPVKAERAPEVDDDAVWILNCANASYSVRLVPDQAALIEPVD